MTLPAPLFPYAVSDGQITVTLSPSVKFKTTSSQHLITYPTPTLNSNG